MTDVLLFIGGIAAGVINAIAGGGSTIVLPLLMLTGMDASTANGTNRIAVLFQSSSATRTFSKRGVIDPSSVRQTLLFVLPSAILGSWIASKMPTKQLGTIFGFCFLILGLTLLVPRPKQIRMPNFARDHMGHICLIMIGFYGGFIQAGVGIPLLIALLHFQRLNFATANATKAICIVVYSTIVIFVFGSAAQVDWSKGVLLGIGGLVGGHAGARWASTQTPIHLHLFLGIFLIGASIKTLLF